MADVGEILEALRGTEMNAWVGGGDPEVVGRDCYFHLMRQVFMVDGGRVLDFGCGIGRTVTALLRERPNQEVVGIDILAPAIEFCRREITTRFPNARFDVLAEGNSHYDHLTNNAKGKSRDQLRAQYADAFDIAYSFSVFTHVGRGEFAGLLRFIAEMLKPGGCYYTTFFGLTPLARDMIRSGNHGYQFPDPVFDADGKVFVGDRRDPLAFVAYDIGLVQELAHEAGLALANLEIGSWSAPQFGWSYQDVLVLRKPKA